MTDALTRSAESAEAAGMQSASIPISDGTWEISAVHVILGGSVATVTVTNVHGIGSVRFEDESQFIGTEEDLRYAQRLLTGHCTLLHALENKTTKIVQGPGRIKSYIIHSDSVVHTLTITYRRMYP